MTLEKEKHVALLTLARGGVELASAAIEAAEAVITKLGEVASQHIDSIDLAAKLLELVDEEKVEDPGELSNARVALADAGRAARAFEQDDVAGLRASVARRRLQITRLRSLLNRAEIPT